jgi:hypothetical membrane protein
LSSSKRVIGLKIAGLCGVTSPIIMLTFILLAIFYSPWFSWAKNALSDLGIRGIAAILFNSSLIIGGLLTLLFAIGLREILLSRTIGHVGALFLILAAANLCAIGIFPETAGSLHLYVSVAFFTLLPTSLLLIGTMLMKEPPERNLGLFTFLAGILAIIVWIIPWGGGVDIPEMLASLPASVWSIVLGIRLYNQAFSLK